MLKGVITISKRDVLFLVGGIVLTCLVRWPGDIRAAAIEPLTRSERAPACGSWVLTPDQSVNRGQFDAFLLNVDTGELFRTEDAGKKMFPVPVTKR